MPVLLCTVVALICFVGRRVGGDGRADRRLERSAIGGLWVLMDGLRMLLDGLQILRDGLWMPMDSLWILTEGLQRLPTIDD